MKWDILMKGIVEWENPKTLINGSPLDSAFGGHYDAYLDTLQEQVFLPQGYVLIAMKVDKEVLDANRK